MKEFLRNIDYNNGLSNEQMKSSKEKYGTNIISSSKKEGFLKMLLSTLGDPIIKILLIALGIKTIFLFKDFDWYETIGIVIAIMLASFISTISEYGSEKAFEKLQEESSKIKCRVLRNKKIMSINIDEVLVGDIILLESGDKIPADGLLIDGGVSVDESSINGETKEAYKEPILTLNSFIEQNQLFRGTVIYSGVGKMIVTSVGDKTFYGRLAKEIQEKQPESPLKIRLRGLAKVISRIGYAGAILVSISYLFSVIIIGNNFDHDLIVMSLTNFPLISGYLLHALTLSVTIIVVAVPEGLPMMITLVLSSNMKRMLKDNVLVRKMVGIETAGSLNILYTDKTGTLTKGKLEVVGLITGDLKEYRMASQLRQKPKLYEMLHLSLVGNNASTIDNEGKIIGGNITDQSLLAFADNKKLDIKKIASLPFDSKNKYSMTVVEKERRLRLIKGAPEKLLPYCTRYYDESGEKRSIYSKIDLQNKVKALTKQGYRLLLLATAEDFGPLSEFRSLVIVGFVLIKDEVRKEAIEGIKQVTNAGISTVMITGDNKDTALAIGKEIGLIKKESDLVLTSDDLRNKSDEEVKDIIPNLKIVARSLPQDKSRLIRLSQEIGLVVGMTGDGVNDAPALKKADVGFAMGSGTEVSKEASDIVILDDNFASITKAILYGRTIFKSIRKFIIFQLTINLCALSLSIICPFIGINTPITIMQMLWINMVMDTLAGLAFAYEPPRKEYMNELPKKKTEPIINRYMQGEIIFTGLYSSILCIIFLKSDYIASLFRNSENNIYLMTAFFGLFIFMGIFNSFNARTHRINLLSHIKENKIFIGVILLILIVQMWMLYFGGTLFRTSGLTFIEFNIMMLCAITVIPVDWIRKIILRKKGIDGGV